MTDCRVITCARLDADGPRDVSRRLGRAPARDRYEAVIGIEVHCQLRTESKMFCACSTATTAPAEHAVCPVCLGLPGALPVINRRAVELSL